ncbi:MAG: hypothetical protein LBU27_03940 [Candidatus Peribacteria bacterium]|jgi:hypothetical protein|nr:hypothetical protein [Candidatus Peribacteria bacterium]
MGYLCELVKNNDILSKKLLKLEINLLIYKEIYFLFHKTMLATVSFPANDETFILFNESSGVSETMMNDTILWWILLQSSPTPKVTINEHIEEN